MPERPLAAEGLKAKRRLLREQTQRLSAHLRWLSDPALIPSSAVPDPGGDSGRAFAALATWMLAELVAAADRVRDELPWAETFARHRLTSDVEDRVLRAVLEPASRHAPGLFALAEIMASIPAVAQRCGADRPTWGVVARRSERLGALLSRNGSDMQVILRRYLRGTEAGWRNGFGLDPLHLRLDDKLNLVTVVPCGRLIEAARRSIGTHIGPDALKGTCVALGALAPEGQSVFSALWTAYSAGAERLIFPRLDPGSALEEPTPDEDFASRIDAIAQARAAELREGLPAQSWEAARRLIFGPGARACTAGLSSSQALG